MVLACEGVMFMFYMLMMAMIFMAVITYYWWPTNQENEYKRLQSLSAVHGKKDWHVKAVKASINEKDNIFKKKGLILAVWVVLFAILYFFTTYTTDSVEYNPYEVLGVVSNSNLTAVKKKYRELSKIFHPDKGGSEESFIKIKQAYETLTNAESMKNWQLYGNPDGKQLVEFGIAIPKALMTAANWVKISLLYLIGMFLFGWVVITKLQEKETDDTIYYMNEETEAIYTKMLSKFPKIDKLSSIIEFFSCAADFSIMNPEIREITQKDWMGLQGLLDKLINVTGIEIYRKGRPKEDLLGHTCTAKARIMLYSHLAGINGGLTAEQEEDRDYVLKKFPILLDKMVNAFERAYINNKIHKKPISLSTITLHKIIDLSQLTIQGQLYKDFPLLQLPNIDQNNAELCGFGQQDSITTLKALACVPEDQRRKILHKLCDNQYEETMKVLKIFPFIQMEADASVHGEEIIFTKNLVTVNIKLSRTSLSKLMVNDNTKTLRNKDNILVAPKDVNPLDEYDCLIEKYKANCEAKKAKHRKRTELQTHTVYSRNFPQEKTEGWWVFIEDKNNSELESCWPKSIRKLDRICQDDEIELKFIAPAEAGKYTYVVWCRSDSMYGCDASVELELYVYNEEGV